MGSAGDLDGLDGGRKDLTSVTSAPPPGVLAAVWLLHAGSPPGGPHSPDPRRLQFPPGHPGWWALQSGGAAGSAAPPDLPDRGLSAAGGAAKGHSRRHPMASLRGVARQRRQQPHSGTSTCH